MNLGINEILILIMNIILILGIPIALVWVIYNLFRRIKKLEARIDQLEAKQNSNSD